MSLWNAAAAGFTAADMLAVLQQYTKFDPAEHSARPLLETVARYGHGKLLRVDEKTLKLVCADKPLMTGVAAEEAQGVPRPATRRRGFAIEPAYRGVLKQMLITLSLPRRDSGGYTEGPCGEVAGQGRDR
ncbi:MAG: hypothetical protein U0792_25520 [Gemmataceae bacterium]